jgi:hypothetical protein
MASNSNGVQTTGMSSLGVRPMRAHSREKKVQ